MIPGTKFRITFVSMSQGTNLRWGFLFLFGFVAHIAVSQSVVFIEEPAVQRMLELQTQANLSPSRLLDVWRIQIAATVDRRQMEDARKSFNRKYHWLTIHTNYSEPYYKLQVGAYYYRRNAEVALQNLKKDFPGAYLVRDKCKLNELSD